mgnify:FL=1
MPKGKVNKALQVLIDEGYLSVSKAKKIVLSYEETQMSFIPKKSLDLEPKAPKSKQDKTKPKQESYKKSTIDPDTRSWLANESQKPFNAVTDMVLFNLWQKKGVLKRTAKSIHHLLKKDNKDIDMLEVMAEIYKSSNSNMVEREKQEVDGRKGVFVYKLTDKGINYVRSII